METVQASRTVPLRPQWAWHYLCDVMRWSLFLPFVTEVRRLEGERFEVILPNGQSTVLKIVLREPTERLEWVTIGSWTGSGSIVIERLGFRTGITVQIHSANPGPFENLQELQTALEDSLERLVIHLSDREMPLERAAVPRISKPVEDTPQRITSLTR